MVKAARVPPIGFFSFFFLHDESVLPIAFDHLLIVNSILFHVFMVYVRFVFFKEKVGKDVSKTSARL